MASPGTDIAFNVARTEGYRAFANKIWNAARFLFMNVDRAAEIGITVDPATLGSMPTVAEDAPLESRWIVAELNATAAKVNQSLEKYRYDDAANTIYQFFWGSFCDWYLEIVKLSLDFPMDGPESESASDHASKFEGRRAALTTLVSVFEAFLRLLSPFMPFISEEVWHALYDGNPPASSIALTRYPSFELKKTKELVITQMGLFQDLVRAIREYRKDLGVPEKQVVKAYVQVAQSDLSEDLNGETTKKNSLLTQNKKWIEKLTVSTLTEIDQGDLKNPQYAGLNWRSDKSHEVAIEDFERQIDVPAERARLTRDIAKFEKGLEAAGRQLGNEAFLAKAPAKVVEGLKKQEAETRLLLEKAQAALDALPKDSL